MTKLSICIPTKDREKYFTNCINSIAIAKKNSKIDLEVCISDNDSNYDIKNVISKYEKNLNIKYHKNSRDIGVGLNILKSASMASGDFVWLIGSDDMLLSKSLIEVDQLFKKNLEVDFYYINSFNIQESELNNIDFPINTDYLKKINKQKYSKVFQTKKVKFDEIINPNISFDFLMSMFLCIFRKKYWDDNIDQVNEKNLSSKNLFSNFDSTCPHSKIWSKAFMKKTAMIYSEPLTANIHGPRSLDWGHLYPFVEGIRIPELVDLHRKNGLPFFKYLRCKNYALRRLVPSLFNIVKNYKYSGLKYININNHLLKNIFYPSIYFSTLYFIIKRLYKNIFKKKL